MEVKPSSLLLSCPFRGFISGSSGSGKSAFILKFLENRSKICREQFDRIIYCSNCNFDFLSEKDANFHKDLRNAVPFIELLSSLPIIEELITSEKKRTLLILDDLISDIIGSEQYAKLYKHLTLHIPIYLY